MNKGFRWLLAVAVVSGLRAQAVAPAEAVRPIGVVTAIDTAQQRITIRTDAGPEMLVLFDSQTAFLRVAPSERDLRNAASIAAGDVAAGDRILARGVVAGDQKSVTASSVIVMPSSEIARKQAADRAEWQKRGMGGIVTAVSPEAREIVVSVPSLAGARKVTIALANGAQLRRYAPDSVKFSDAQPSRLEEIQIGDQVKALGSKSEDGTRFTAEQLVSGSFLNLAATVDAISPAEGALEVTDLATRKRLRVRVTADSNLRALPPLAAQMLARRNAGQEGPARALPPGGRPPERDLESMLGRMPTLSLADLKRGDVIAVASTRGANPSQITAITILAGIEPLLTAAPQGSQQRLLGSWNLDLNMNMP